MTIDTFKVASKPFGKYWNISYKNPRAWVNSCNITSLKYSVTLLLLKKLFSVDISKRPTKGLFVSGSKYIGTAEANTPWGKLCSVSNFTTIKKSDLISAPLSKIGSHFLILLFLKSSIIISLK